MFRLEKFCANSAKCWTGPEFLQRPEEELPNDLACENTDPIAMAEVTKHKTDVVYSLANQAKPLNSDIRSWFHERWLAGYPPYSDFFNRRKNA